MRDVPGCRSGAQPDGLTPDRLFRAADLSHLAFHDDARAYVGAHACRSATGRGGNKAGCRAGVARLQHIRDGSYGGPHLVLFAPDARDGPSSGKPPMDWVYVNNFTAPHRRPPSALRRPAQRRCRAPMRKLIEDLRVTLRPCSRATTTSAVAPRSTRHCAPNTQKVFQPWERSDVARAGHHTHPYGVHRRGDGERRDRRCRRIQQVAGGNAGIATQEAIGRSSGKWRKACARSRKLEKGRRDAVHCARPGDGALRHQQEIDEVRVMFSDLPQVIAPPRCGSGMTCCSMCSYSSGIRRRVCGTARCHAARHPFERYDVNVLVSNDAGGRSPVVEELIQRSAAFSAASSICLFKGRWSQTFA